MEKWKKSRKNSKKIRKNHHNSSFKKYRNFHQTFPPVKNVEKMWKPTKIQMKTSLKRVDSISPNKKCKKNIEKV